MNLQNTFYLTTIIMEVFAILLLVALVILVFVMMKKFADLSDTVDKKFTQLSDNVNKQISAAGQIVEHPSDVATDIALSVGAALATGAAGQVKKIFSSFRTK
jgi:uncharacterized membrane protein